METARILAGFSMAEADDLRRAMGKKNPDLLAKYGSKFIVGCAKRNVDRSVAESIFNQMQEFASYAFNKSHSAGYAIIAYQTAWLKAYFPEEFFAALMTCDEDKIEKLVPIIAEGRSKSIPILPPDINTSGRHFTVVRQDGTGRKAIRFGLLGVKGVGSSAVDAILKARKDGPFEDLFDFCSRVDLRACNRANIDQLVKSGAFEETASAAGLHRARVQAALDAALEVGKMRMRDREEGQTDLLGMLASAGASTSGRSMQQDYPPARESTHRELLAMEKAALGCYVTGHPLDKFQADQEAGRHHDLRPDGRPERRDRDRGGRSGGDTGADDPWRQEPRGLPHTGGRHRPRGGCRAARRLRRNRGEDTQRQGSACVREGDRGAPRRGLGPRRVRCRGFRRDPPGHAGDRHH
jgi:DNA polymerase-3 subunit alpha